MGCGESKHAVSTQNSTVNQSKRLNSKKNTEENVTGGGGDGNAVIVKESDDALKVVPQAEKVDQILQKERGDDQNVKDGGDKEASPPPAAVVAVAKNGDGSVKEAEKVDQVVLQKQIDQPKEESMAENVKEAEDKEASPPPDAAAAVVAVEDEAKGGEEKKELKEENPTEPKMEDDAKILAQPTDTDASEEKKDSGEVKEPTKEIETHQGAKNDKDLENQKEANIETGKAEAVESAEAKDSAQTAADEKIPTAKWEIEVESAAEAEKKAD